MGRPSETDRARLAAHAKLTALIRAHLDAGHRIPCIGGAAWTSGLYVLEVQAARSCKACPVLQECGAYADEHQEPSGVWGGQRRSEHNQQAPLFDMEEAK